MQNRTVRKTLEQGRAEFAYKCVEQVLNLKKFSFGSNIIDYKRVLTDGLKKKLNKEYKEYPVYKEFIENSEEKYEEYLQQLERVKGKNRKFESEKEKLESNVKESIVTYYKKYQKDYKAYAKKIPMLIKNNGLGATLAFVNSKAKDGNAYELLYYQIGGWLKNCNFNFIDLSNEKDLVAHIIALDSAEYRAVTIEVLAFFNWLKRFVDGFIEEGDEVDEP